MLNTVTYNYATAIIAHLLHRHQPVIPRKIRFRKEEGSRSSKDCLNPPCSFDLGAMRRTTHKAACGCIDFIPRGLKARSMASLGIFPYAFKQLLRLRRGSLPIVLHIICSFVPRSEAVKVVEPLDPFTEKLISLLERFLTS